MTRDDCVAALDLPTAARLEQRVPKTLLVEHGAPTAADRRRINDGIEDVYWIAALKPTTVGVPAFRDAAREYLEIAVLTATMRDGARAGRLIELIHRAIPYPVLLLSTQEDTLTISLAHKRHSQGETDATVLDGEAVTSELLSEDPATLRASFRESLALTRQPRAHLYALYQGWIDSLLALVAGRITGDFRPAASPERSAVRQEALRDCSRLEAEIARLRKAAARERQVARLVELNLELKRVEQQRSMARQKL